MHLQVSVGFVFIPLTHPLLPRSSWDDTSCFRLSHPNCTCLVSQSPTLCSWREGAAEFANLLLCSERSLMVNSDKNIVLFTGAFWKQGPYPTSPKGVPLIMNIFKWSKATEDKITRAQDHKIWRAGWTAAALQITPGEAAPVSSALETWLSNPFKTATALVESTLQDLSWQNLSPRPVRKIAIVSIAIFSKGCLSRFPLDHLTPLFLVISEINVTAENTPQWSVGLLHTPLEKFYLV